MERIYEFNFAGIIATIPPELCCMLQFLHVIYDSLLRIKSIKVKTNVAHMDECSSYHLTFDLQVACKHLLRQVVISYMFLIY